MKAEDIRPRGSVTVDCTKCKAVTFWVDALDPRLPNGPFLCFLCDPGSFGKAKQG